MEVNFLAADNPIQRVPAELKRQLLSAQQNLLPSCFKDAGELCGAVFEQAKLNLQPPKELSQQPVSDLADAEFKQLRPFFEKYLIQSGVPHGTATHHAVTISERVQLVSAFSDPETMIAAVKEKVETIVGGFPATAADIQVGKNPGDVLDPFIIAATQELMFGGDFEPTMEATVSHKVLMMIEGLMGHLHEDVVGGMRGNVRVPEPRGKDQETLHPENNPFPGADVVQPPYAAGQQMRFHQIKSKTGSAKGGDGRRLGEQLKRLQDLYGGDMLYHALVGNTLRGHRSKTGVEKAAPGVIVVVGEASFEELTGRKTGPELLLRLYKSAFQEVAQKTGYRVDVMAAGIVETFRQRAEDEGDGFLEVILHDATKGPRNEQDNRLFKPARSRQKKLL